MRSIDAVYRHEIQPVVGLGKHAGSTLRRPQNDFPPLQDVLNVGEDKTSRCLPDGYLSPITVSHCQHLLSSPNNNLVEWFPAPNRTQPRSVLMAKRDVEFVDIAQAHAALASLAGRKQTFVASDTVAQTQEGYWSDRRKIEDWLGLLCERRTEDLFDQIAALCFQTPQFSGELRRLVQVRKFWPVVSWLLTEPRLDRSHMMVVWDALLQPGTLAVLLRCYEGSPDFDTMNEPPCDLHTLQSKLQKLVDTCAAAGELPGHVVWLTQKDAGLRGEVASALLLSFAAFSDVIVHPLGVLLLLVLMTNPDFGDAPQLFIRTVTASMCLLNDAAVSGVQKTARVLLRAAGAAAGKSATLNSSIAVAMAVFSSESAL
ncbi:MAG: uncharacterized protein KVP18_005167 [Porospora cf. gigantea A]|uniref:uncharacterized protein n=1 Tax=Porospora cf. gigantea A TaxID=2853593 RepID=UPI003559838B|nr:MAG: hypothetical protein KVP18_005167 [Porospora cf. gigantea A]